MKAAYHLFYVLLVFIPTVLAQQQNATSIVFRPLGDNNAPIVLLNRQSLDYLQTKRVPFQARPYIPLDATIQSWTWKMDTPAEEIPAWLMYSTPFEGSDEFAVIMKAPQGSADEVQQEPAPARLHFSGEVKYKRTNADGKSNTVTANQAVVLQVEMHLAQPFQTKASGARDRDAVSGSRLVLRPSRTAIPDNLTLEHYETMTLTCGAASLTSDEVCSLCTGSCEWSMGSILNVAQGRAQILTPHHSFATIVVAEGAILDIAPGANKVVELSTQPADYIQNDGTIRVLTGTLRIRAPLNGKGQFQVAPNAVLEFDTDPTLPPITLAAPSAASANVLRNEGFVNFTSGAYRFVSPLVSSGSGQVSVREGAMLHLDSNGVTSTTHVLGSESAVRVGLDNQGIVQVGDAIVRMLQPFENAGLLHIQPKGLVNLMVSQKSSSNIGGSAWSQGQAFLNQGTLNAQQGQLTFKDAYYAHGEARQLFSSKCKVVFDSLATSVLGGNETVNFGSIQLNRGVLALASRHFAQNGQLSASPNTEIRLLEGANVVQNGRDLDLSQASLTINPQATWVAVNGTKTRVDKLVQKGTLRLESGASVEAGTFTQSSPSALTNINRNALLGSGNPCVFMEGNVAGESASLGCHVDLHAATFLSPRLPGSVHVSGNLRLYPQSEFEVLITNDGSGLKYDQLVVDGETYLDGTVLVSSSAHVLQEAIQKHYSTQDINVNKLDPLRFHIIRSSKYSGRFANSGLNLQAQSLATGSSSRVMNMGLGQLHTVQIASVPDDANQPIQVALQYRDDGVYLVTYYPGDDISASALASTFSLGVHLRTIMFATSFLVIMFGVRNYRWLHSWL